MTNMRVSAGFILFLLSALILSGCAVATSVSVRPGKGGVVAVTPRNSPEARDKAVQIMSATCGGRGYTIVQEQEVVVGHVISTSRQGDIDVRRRRDATVSSWEETTTSPQTEWRITYTCQ